MKSVVEGVSAEGLSSGRRSKLWAADCFCADAPTRLDYIDDALCDVISCYGCDVNTAVVAARGANDKDGSSA